MDAELTARKQSEGLSPENLKNLFDKVEGGTVSATGYHAAVLPERMGRIYSWNGRSAEMGKKFRESPGLKGIAHLLDALVGDTRTADQNAVELLKNLTGDEQAWLRRVAIGIVPDNHESLITPEFLNGLHSSTDDVQASAKKRRRLSGHLTIDSDP